MKKAIFILSLSAFTGMSAQNTPIQVEVVDRTEITMLAAQYDIMQREKRQARSQENYDTAHQINNNIQQEIRQLSKLTDDAAIQKRISKAYKLNNDLLKLYNLPNRQSKGLIRLQTEIIGIRGDINKLKPSR